MAEAQKTLRVTQINLPRSRALVLARSVVPTTSWTTSLSAA